MQKIVAMNPMGYPPEIEQLGMAPRLDSLDGKTVYLVDCRFDDGDIFLQQMHNWLIDGQISSWQLRKVLCGKGLVDFQLSGFTDFNRSWLTGEVRNNPFHRSTIMV